jgi:tetratricopeptide (TPR) repeat protein
MFYSDVSMIERGKTPFRPLAAFLVLIVISFLGRAVHSQDNAGADSVLPPPKPDLVAVHWPDLSKLEADVREQLTSIRSALIRTVREPAATEAALGEMYGTTGQFYQAYSLNPTARECYRNAIKLSPQDFRWIYLLGKLDQQDDRPDDAIQSFLQVRKLRPDYAAAPVNLGNIYLQQNRLEDASENFKAALAVNSREAGALYGLGQVALSQRSYLNAVEYFEKALNLVPGANRIHYSLAMAYRGLGDSEKATAHFAQQGTVGVRVSDSLWDGLQDLVRGEQIHLIRGKLALESQRYADAADEFRKAIKANEQSVTAHVNLGGALIQTGNSRDAAEQFEIALRIDPKTASAHYNLAVLLAQAQQHEPAIAHLRSILSVDAEDLSARFFLAQELLKSNRTEEALSEFSRVIEANPDNEDALIEQVKLLQQAKRYREALAGLEKGHKQFPQKGRTAATLAYLLAASPQFDLRDGARALELAQLIYKATGSIEHGALVAMALAELGRCAEAAEWQRRMIAAAEQQGKTDLLNKLKGELPRYEQGQACRPPGESVR